MVCIQCGGTLAVLRMCREIVLRCDSCGARLSLSDYYGRDRARGAAKAVNEDELERHLANVPVNRL